MEGQFDANHQDFRGGSQSAIHVSIHPNKLLHLPHTTLITAVTLAILKVHVNAAMNHPLWQNVVIQLLPCRMPQMCPTFNHIFLHYTLYCSPSTTSYMLWWVHLYLLQLLLCLFPLYSKVSCVSNVYWYPLSLFVALPMGQASQPPHVWYYFYLCHHILFFSYYSICRWITDSFFSPLLWCVSSTNLSVLSSCC